MRKLLVIAAAMILLGSDTGFAQVAANFGDTTPAATMPATAPVSTTPSTIGAPQVRWVPYSSIWELQSRPAAWAVLRRAQRLELQAQQQTSQSALRIPREQEFLSLARQG